MGNIVPADVHRHRCIDGNTQPALAADALFFHCVFILKPPNHILAAARAGTNRIFGRHSHAGERAGQRQQGCQADRQPFSQ